MKGLASLSSSHLSALESQFPGFLYQLHLFPDGRRCFPYISSGVKSVCGLRPEKVLADANTFFSLILGDKLPGVLEALDTSARDLSPINKDFRIVGKKSGRRWVCMKGEPTRMPDGSTLWNGFVTDITEFKETDLELQNKSNFIRTVTNHTLGLVAYWDRDLRNVFANPSCKNWLGRSPDEMAGMHLREVVGEAQFNARLPYIKQALEGETQFFESTLRNLSGDDRKVQVSYVPDWQNGQVNGFFVLVYDITDTNGADSLRKATLNDSMKLALVAQKTTSGVLITDTLGKIEWANHAFLQMTGYEEHDILGKHLHDLHGPDTDREVSAAIKQAFDVLRPFDVEILNYTKKRAHIWFHKKGDPISNSDGVSGQYAIILTDITERRQLEVKLRQAQKMEIIGRLAGGVAHDFNNILGALMLSLDSVPKNEETDMFIEESIQLVKQAAKSTKRLVEFSRRQILRFLPVDLNEVVSHFSTNFKRTARTGINIVVELNSSYSWVLGDRGLLSEVVTNLCENAVDAIAQEGNLTLSVDAVPFGIKQLTQDSERRTGSFICIRVKDDGCGMKDEVKERLYEPFFTTKQIGKGTGLGLASVHGIVHQHKGWIEVDSEVGKGTEFRVYLPVAKMLGRSGSSVL